MITVSQEEEEKKNENSKKEQKRKRSLRTAKGMGPIDCIQTDKQVNSSHSFIEKQFFIRLLLISLWISFSRFSEYAIHFYEMAKGGFLWHRHTK